MIGKVKRNFRNGGLIFMAQALILLACRFTAPTPVAWVGTSTAWPATQSAAAITPTQTPEPLLPSQTPVPSATPAPSVQAGQAGPWLIFPNAQENGLYALELGSDHLGGIDIPALIDFADLTNGIAPDGSALVVRAGNVDDLDNLGLYEITNPMQSGRMISPLLGEFVREAIRDRTDNQAAFALQAVLQPEGLAWRPNSQSLVFSAALEGIAANLYRYQPASGQASRLTVRYQQDFKPVWSPDGQLLVFQEADTLNNPGGWQPYLFTSLNLSNTGRLTYVDQIALPDQARIVAGWLNPAQLVTYSLTANGVKQAVRLVNAQSGRPASIIFKGSFDDIAVNPNAGQAAIAVSAATSTGSGLSAGIYLYQSGRQQAELLLNGDFNSLEYHPQAGVFSASGALGLTLFSPGKNTLSFPDDQQAAYAPSGSWLLTWGSNGARLNAPDGKPLQVISAEGVSAAIWQPDSRGFYLLKDAGLFHYQFPLLRETLVCDDVSRTDPGWFVWLNGR